LAGNNPVWLSNFNLFFKINWFVKSYFRWKATLWFMRIKLRLDVYELLFLSSSIKKLLNRSFFLKRNLALYFQRVLTFPPYREHEEVAKLLGVSPLSFMTDGGQSLFEGVMFKNSGEGTEYGCFRKTKNFCEVLKICDEKRFYSTSCLI